MKNSKPFVLISCILFFAACHEMEDTSLEGVWVGAAVEADKEIYQPLPFLLIAREDGQYNSYPIQKPDSNWKNWEFKSKVLRLDTNTFISPKYELSENELIFNYPYKVFYHRATQKLANSLPELSNHLKGSSWESDDELLQFSATDELIIQQKKPLDQIEKLCWEVRQDLDYTFIIKKGNQLGCEEFPRFLELVTAMDENSFTVERWQGGSWQAIKYEKVNKTDLTPPDFQLCNPYLIRSNAQHRYYYKNTFYKGGIYKINKLFKAFYKPPINSTENGLVKVEFIVNCKGLPGRFSVLEMDENYKEKSFSPEITKQLLAFTKTLKDWNAGRNDKNEAVDTYRFLIYRIENGKVIEIYP